MSLNVTNDNGTPLLYVNARVKAGDVTLFTGHVPCAAGMWLAASSAASAKIEAKRHGTADAFSDLNAAPINLTPYDTQTVQFDFRVTGMSVTTSARAALRVRVTHNP